MDSNYLGLVERLDRVDERYMRSSTGPLHVVYLGTRLYRSPFMATICQQVAVAVLWYLKLGSVSRQASWTTVIWSCAGRSVLFVHKGCGPIRLFLLDGTTNTSSVTTG